MTLRKQIKDIHSRHFSKEFHAYRQDIVPAMVNDLKMKFFDDLVLVAPTMVIAHWSIRDSVDIRAVRQADKLMRTMDLRENTPAVD